MKEILEPKGIRRDRCKKKSNTFEKSFQMLENDDILKTIMFGNENLQKACRKNHKVLEYKKQFGNDGIQ